MKALVSERERGGPYEGLADLASRSGVEREGLERLAWAGALDAIAAAGERTTAGGRQYAPQGAKTASTTEEQGAAGDAARSGRRPALWRLGAAAGGRAQKGGTQLSLPLEPP